MILDGKTLIEVLPLRELYTDYRSHKRLMVFVHKGRKCVTCHREGTLLLVTLEKNGKAKHVDLYTDDFVLMTVDHIVPRYQGKQIGWSRRARESMKNKQPMCSPCNNSKGSKLISNEEHRKNRMRQSTQKLASVEVIRQLVHNENIFNRNLEGIKL